MIDKLQKNSIIKLMKVERFICGSYFWVINLLFITLATFLVADITNLFIGKKLEMPIKTFPQAISATIREPHGAVDDYSKIILERNIFGSRPKIIVKPLKGHSIVAGTDLKLKLIGTVAGDAGSSYAVIEDQTSREQNLYRLNDLIAGKARLVKIGREEVVLLHQGKREPLRIYTEESQGSEKTVIGKTQMQSSSASLSVVRQGRYILDKREVAAAMENLPQLLTQARVIPNFTNGRAEGFKVINIAQNSFYDKIGLKNGDVLQKINGIDINEPENFLKVFQQLKDESNITLDLTREGNKTTFKYEIR